jgi:peptide/nickel transport system substrate-binding protein
MSGFDGQTRLTLVRNPRYRASTDSRAARESLPDSFQFLVDSSATDVMDKVALGELDDELPTIPPQKLRPYVTDPDLKRYLHVNPSDSTFYLTMNLTQPPFDDVHVRRALNWVMDKAALVQAWGGSVSGKVANHIVPDTMLGNLLAEFAPYATPGDHGSVEKARAAMKGSRYDTKHDGTCGAAQCKGVLLVADTLEVDTKMVPVITASAAKIGITFTVRPVSGAYPAVQVPTRTWPCAEKLSQNDAPSSGCDGWCESRTQGAPVAALSGRPRTQSRAAQRGRAAPASFCESS